MGRVFINYRSVDTNAYGSLLYAGLSQRLGSEMVFMDSLGIPAGADYEEQLLSQVRRSAAVLAVIGPQWLQAEPNGQRRIDDPRDWVRRELSAAFAAGVPVVPVLTDGATMPAEADLPPDIAPLTRCQYRRLRHKEPTGDLDRLVGELATLDPGLRAAAALHGAVPFPAAAAPHPTPYTPYSAAPHATAPYPGADRPPAAHEPGPQARARDGMAVVAQNVSRGRFVDRRIGTVKKSNNLLIIIMVIIAVVAISGAAVLFRRLHPAIAVDRAAAPPGQKSVTAQGRPPWTVDGYGLKYTVTSVRRGTSTWMDGPKPSITITAYITRTARSDFSMIECEVSDQDGGTVLDGVPFEGDATGKPPLNPPLNQRRKLTWVVWDSQPRATHLTITLHDFYWPDGTDLILRTVGVPAG